MSAALGCGPRDTLMVILGRKMPKAPMAVMSIVSSPMAAKIAEFYGCHMRLQLYKQLRGEKKFESLEALRAIRGITGVTFVSTEKEA